MLSLSDNIKQIKLSRFGITQMTVPWQMWLTDWEPACVVFKVVWHPQHAVLVMGWLGRHSYGPSVETCPCKLKVTSNTECWVVCVLSRKVIGDQGFASSQSDPAGCDLEMPATRRWRWQLHSGAQIQEWNCHFCPLFPMETMPSTAPSTCYPHSSVHRDQDYPSLTRGTWLVLLALLLQWTSLALCQWPWFPRGCSLPTCWRVFF